MNDRPEREPAAERSAIRLFVRAALEAGAPVVLDAAQAHYLRHVMRQAPGARVRLFNGRDGEWEGTIETLAPSRAGIRIGARRAAQTPAPDLRLLFAPLKAERTRFTVEKATELGVGALHPVLTRHGQTRRVNTARLRAHAIEAAEQCGRLDVPQIVPPCPLADALAAWPPERRLLVCDPQAARLRRRRAGRQQRCALGDPDRTRGRFRPRGEAPAPRSPGGGPRPPRPAHPARRDRRGGRTGLLSGPRGRLAMRPRRAGRRPAMSLLEAR